MGYEVIDEHGTVAGGDRGPTSMRRPEPYDLGELEPVLPAPTTDAPDDPTRPPERSGRRARIDRLIRLPAVPTSAALVVGALVGGYVVHQHGVGEQQAQARSAVNAVAVTENQLATGINGVRMATLTVRLTNFGPLPLEPVLSPDRHRPTTREPLVDAATSHPRAAPNGGSTLVTVTVPLPCDTHLGQLQLPVRTADNSTHELTITSVASEILEQDRTMCYQESQPQPLVEAWLSGSVDQPYIVIRNVAAQARRVWLQDRAPGDWGAETPRGISIRLTPSLPQDVDGGGTVRLKLDVKADHCERDVAELQQADMWIAFQDTNIGMSVPPPFDEYRGYVGVGIGPVITNAFIRACR